MKKLNTISIILLFLVAGCAALMVLFTYIPFHVIQNFIYENVFLSFSYPIFPFYIKILLFTITIFLLLFLYRDSVVLKKEIKRREEVEKESLEKGKKLEEALALSRATLEATADGILVVDRNRRIVGHNEIGAKMWKTPSEVLRPGNDEEAIKYVLKQLKDPEGFLKSLDRLYNSEPGTEHLDELEFKDGRIFERYTKPQMRGKEIIGRVFSFRDVTQRKQMEAQLIYQATHDILTLLPNRVILLDRVNQAIKNSKRSHQMGALLFFDLDQFKLINDSLGHALGDALLQSVARRLEYFSRENDTVARWGGDEFAILLPTLAKEEEIIPIVERYLTEIAKPFSIEQHSLSITSSVGVCFFPKDGQNALTLLKNADSAMYAAKAESPNTFKFYVPQMTARTEKQLQLANDLRDALYKDQLSLEYQPLVNLKTGKIVGAEALIRWYHPLLGNIPPNEFIHIAEETGLILSIGEWVLQTACIQAKKWQKEGLPPITIAINLSAQQFKLSDIEETIIKILDETKLDPKHLELELTESIIMENTEMYLNIMKVLKKIGIGLAIDDFGTGYSSLSYLKRFPVDKIKIDQSFIADLPDDKDGNAIVRAILAMAKQLNLKVIAEGIETKKQLAFLRMYECDMGQGYFFSKPLSGKDFQRLMKKINTKPKKYPNPFLPSFSKSDSATL